MAQAKRKRRRKHRGTQGGRVDPSRRPRPRSRAEAKAQMRSRAKSKRSPRSKSSRAERFQRGMRPPTWRSAMNRGFIAAGVFFALIVLLFRQTVPQALTLALLMLLLYIPMGYMMDGFFYRRRLRQEERARGQS